MPTCTATTKAGTACKAWAKYGQFCLVHARTDESEAELSAMRRRGLRKMRRTHRWRLEQRERLAGLKYPAPPKDIAEARGYLAWIADSALRGLLAPVAARTATATIREWIIAEGYAGQIRELTKKVKEFTRADARKKAVR